MSSIYLFDVASQQARWLGVKQATIANNVSNANTPGFRAREVEPFSDAMDKMRLTVATTQAGHIDLGGAAADPRSGTAKSQDSWDITHSGNSVSLEQEMVKAGDVNRIYSLNTSIVKAFHRMYLSSLK